MKKDNRSIRRNYYSRYGKSNDRKRQEEFRSDGISKAFHLQIFLFIFIVSLLLILKLYFPQDFKKISTNLDILVNEESVIDVEAKLNDISSHYSNIIGKKQNGMGGMFPIDNVGEAQALMAPKGASLSPVMVTSNLLLPIENGRVTSTYGYRYHPITDKLDFHTGTDIAASEETPILATLYGKVIEIGKSDIYGNYIVLQHCPNFKTVYSHCHSIIAPLGTYVKQGDRIATVGSTGVSTGPHLHLEVIIDGLYADPAWVYKELQSEV